MHTAVTLFD